MDILTTIISIYNNNTKYTNRRIRIQLKYKQSFYYKNFWYCDVLENFCILNNLKYELVERDK